MATHPSFPGYGILRGDGTVCQLTEGQGWKIISASQDKSDCVHVSVKDADGVTKNRRRNRLAMTFKMWEKFGDKKTLPEDWRDGIVDHIDSKRTNGSFDNLQLLEPIDGISASKQNARKAKMNSRNTSGIRGICSKMMSGNIFSTGWRKSLTIKVAP